MHFYKINRKFHHLIHPFLKSFNLSQPQSILILYLRSKIFRIDYDLVISWTFDLHVTFDLINTILTILNFITGFRKIKYAVDTVMLN
jgi:hypothetical protein